MLPVHTFIRISMHLRTNFGSQPLLRHLNARHAIRASSSSIPGMKILLHSASDLNLFATFSSAASSSIQDADGDNKGDFDAPVKTKRAQHWEAMLEELIKYREKHGDTLVPAEYDLNPKLGTWGESVLSPNCGLFEMVPNAVSNM